MRIRSDADPSWTCGLVVRRARKEHWCHGDGSATPRRSPRCLVHIAPGNSYLEVLWNAPAYTSGNAVCPNCAVLFYAEFVERAG